MRLVLQIFTYLILILGLILLGAYLYFFTFGGVEKMVNDKINALVSEKYPLDIEVGSIKGGLTSHLVIEDMTIYYHDSLHHYQLLKLPRLKASYSLANLWNEQYVFDFLELDSAEITFIKDQSGNWVIPDFSPKGEQAAVKDTVVEI